MGEIKIQKPPLPQPIDLTLPLPEVLGQLKEALDSKRIEKYRAVEELVLQLQAEGRMSKRTAFRVLRRMSGKKQPRIIADLFLLLKFLGYTTVKAEEKNYIGIAPRKF